jgi:hypothetical protein
MIVANSVTLSENLPGQIEENDENLSRGVRNGYFQNASSERNR